MDDFLFAALQVRNAIVREYLDSHPQVKEQDITACAGSAMVFKTLDHVFQAIGAKKLLQQTTDSVPQDELEQNILEDENARCMKSLQSVQNSARLIQFMLKTIMIPFGQPERDQNLAFLKDREKNCVSNAVEQCDYRRKLVSLLDHVKPTASIIQTLVTQYLQSIVAQIKCQHALYKRELELGETFHFYVRQVLKTNLSTLPPEAVNKTAKTLQDMHEVLEKNTQSEESASGTGEKIPFFKLVKKFETQIQNQREKVEALEKVITFIEDVVEQMKSTTVGQKIESTPLMPEAPSPAPKAKTFNRMVFSKPDRSR